MRLGIRLSQRAATTVSAGEGADLLIVDCDEQATSKNWIDRRDDAIKAGAKIPKIHIAQKTGKVYDAISDFASRYQLVIVDVGGGDTQETRTALAAR